MKLENKVFEFNKKQAKEESIKNSVLVANGNTSEITLGSVMINGKYKQSSIDGYSILEAMKKDERGYYLLMNDERVYIEFLNKETNEIFSFSKIRNATFMFPSRTVKQEYVTAIVEDIYAASKKQNKTEETVEQKEVPVEYSDKILMFDMSDAIKAENLKVYRYENFVLFIGEEKGSVLLFELLDGGDYDTLVNYDELTEEEERDIRNGEKTKVNGISILFIGEKLTIEC